MTFKRFRKSTSHSSTKLHSAKTADIAWHQVAAKNTKEWDYFKGRGERNQESTRIKQTPQAVPPCKLVNSSAQITAVLTLW